MKSSHTYFLHLSFHFSLSTFFFSFVYFVLTCDPAAAKLQPMAAEGGASSHSRLQRCMRRARSLQQRLQLQLQQQQEEEEGQQLQEQPRYRPQSARPIRSESFKQVIS